MKMQTNPSSLTNTCGLNYCTMKTARVSNGFPVFIPKIIARFSQMQNTYMMDSNDRSKYNHSYFLDTFYLFLYNIHTNHTPTRYEDAL